MTYKKYTHKEHILARPDTYIGSVVSEDTRQWIVRDEQMIEKQCTYVNGLFKIFDEILVNAMDQCTIQNVDKICVQCDEYSISVTNGGQGVPIEKHKEYGDIWIPELIFGNLLTSSNYNDNEKRTTGGRNGYGAKLTNLFSTSFTIDTASTITKQRYVQQWTNNMENVSKPKITKYSKTKGYTSITFYPDLKRFNLESLHQDDIRHVIERRVYDCCACTSDTVKVYFNNKLLQVKTFDRFVSLFPVDKRVTDTSNDGRWTVAVGVSSTGYKQISFVNGIQTINGGSHVDYVSNQVVKKLTEYIQSKHKNVKIKPTQIKDYLFMFVKSTIDNPSFSSQTKTELTSRYKDFGTRYDIHDDIIKKIYKLGFVDELVSLAKHKEVMEMSKTDGRKQSSVRGIPKLEDATKAGTKDSAKCTLILTEGDSAKTFAISGLGVVGRDYYGVFPLKGKLLNVRDASPKQMMNNEEISNIKKILGLQQDKKYDTVKDLRYGNVLILTDADVDGSHIKGLFINFIHNFWPNLLQHSFVTSMRTPILKAYKGSQTLSFYTQYEYDRWKENQQGWRIKYYKGLGTSTAQEAKEYFREFDKHHVTYTYESNQTNEIELAFKKTLSDTRKSWISNGTKVKQVLDTNESHVSMKDFIHKDLIWFSIADNVRSIPHVMDGLKPSQRKVLYACRKRSNSEIKVSQLAGYVSTATCYHHGEQSMMSTIIGMAQDFVGSNGMNLLVPKGQFGTRLMGGKDAASPRYIFTQLHTCVETLFPKEDDALLNYIEDDGVQVEPDFFLPTLPLVLINGAEGIGTGYSTFVPCYNPSDIIRNIKCVLNNEEQPEMVPWYKNFKGTIKQIDEHKYETHGIVEKNHNTWCIKELPIGKWTSDYKEYLEQLVDKGILKKVTNRSTESIIEFEIVIDNVDKPPDLKLISNINTSNMHLFDNHGQIKKYDTPQDIILEYVGVRLNYYTKRKNYLLREWNQECYRMNQLIKFMEFVMNDSIIIFKQSHKHIIDQMIKHDLDELLFEHMLNIKLSTFTTENIAKRYQDLDVLKRKIEKLHQQTPKDLWLNEI